MEEYRRQLRTYLVKSLGIKPGRLEVYEQAFLHRSFIHEQNLDTHNSNERLELLGDSVLGLAITESLLKRYPTSEEGDLSKMKAQLGSRQTLGEVSRRLGLSAFLRVGRGEELSRSNSLPSLIGNAFEALVGAVYLDRGYVEGARFVIRCLEPEFQKDLIAKDYKSVLQEYTQRRFHAPPFYQVVRTFGPEHRKTFEVLMKLNGRVYGRGRGQTKKDAEQDAARLTLRRMGYQPEQGVQPAQTPLDKPTRRWYWPFGNKKERLI
jgi:ribonuclease-3